jgi:hypothetical protein
MLTGGRFIDHVPVSRSIGLAVEVMRADGRMWVSGASR